MTTGAGAELPSASGWRTPLLLGRHHKGLQKVDAWLPQWTNDASRAAALRFDGADNCAILPSRAMPYGPFTLELNVLPEQEGRAMTLFADTCGVSLKLTPDGNLRLSRLKSTATGQRTLPLGRWTHVAAVYTGEQLKLYVDGALDAEAPAETQALRINSLGVVGNSYISDEGFQGLVGGLHLQCGVLALRRFALKARLNPEPAPVDAGR
jgi:hypothetical protein